MSNLYTGALPLFAIRAAQAQRAAQSGAQKTVNGIDGHGSGESQDIKTCPCRCRNAASAPHLG